MSFLNRPADAWRRMIGEYETVLKAKAATIKDVKKRDNFLTLDKWYQEDLPRLITSRKEKHITRDELSRLMTWKLTRGKFRPRLQKMVEENDPEKVETASKEAFKALPNLRAAIGALSVLKAVGPATASAVLAAGAPEHVPFMADESLMAIPALQPIKYTVPAYLEYAKEVAMIVQNLSEQDADFQWTPHRVELALWTFQMAQTLKLQDVLTFEDEAGDCGTSTQPDPAKPKKSGKSKPSDNETARNTKASSKTKASGSKKQQAEAETSSNSNSDASESPAAKKTKSCGVEAPKKAKSRCKSSRK